MTGQRVGTRGLWEAAGCTWRGAWPGPSQEEVVGGPVGYGLESDTPPLPRSPGCLPGSLVLCIFPHGLP